MKKKFVCSQTFAKFLNYTLTKYSYPRNIKITIDKFKDKLIFEYCLNSN